MWEKFKAWIKKQQDKHNEKMETLVWEELLGCKIVPGTVHPCVGTISSVYFNQDKEWIAVDFSRWEETGIAHFMLFTVDDALKYGASEEINEKGSITTYLPETIIFMRKFQDGSASWCFRF